MRKEKGITLVALIITIIIMLILVAVSVNILIKSNLIGTAEKTANGYRTAQDREANGSQIEINGKKYDSIEDYLAGKEAIPEIHNWVRTGDNLACKHCNKMLTIGQELNYTTTGAEIININATKSGTDMEQTLSKDSETKWIVFGIEDRNQNNTNETLLLTTEKPTDGKVSLSGAKGWVNGTNLLDEICEEMYGKGVKSMTMNEVKNTLQIKQTGIGVGNKVVRSFVEYDIPDASAFDTIPYFDLRTNEKTKMYYSPYCEQGSNDTKIFETIKCNSYWYSTTGSNMGIDMKDGITQTSNISKKVVFGENADFQFWLATTAAVPSYEWFAFKLFSVDQGDAGAFEGGTLYDSNGESYTSTYSIRPIVRITDNIPE